MTGLQFPAWPRDLFCASISSTIIIMGPSPGTSVLRQGVCVTLLTTEHHNQQSLPFEGRLLWRQGAGQLTDSARLETCRLKARAA